MARGYHFALAALATISFGPSTAAGGAPVAVVVMTKTSSAVRVRVAAGMVRPCQSSANQLLFDGQVAPQHPIGLWSPQRCVCEEHTSPAFPDSEWLPANIRCGCGGRHCDHVGGGILIVVPPSG
jgi:hypothetical protein